MEHKDGPSLRVDPLERIHDQAPLISRTELLVGKGRWVDRCVGIAPQLVAPVGASAMLRRDPKREPEEPGAHGSAGFEITQVLVDLNENVVREIFEIGRWHAQATE